MDVSDGLALDLRRLCQESGVGAEIIAEELPLSDRFEALCDRIGSGPLELALGGGEDYILLFTLPEGIAPVEPGARRIGQITRSKRKVLRQGGVARELPELGWDHFEETMKSKSPGSGSRGLEKNGRQ